MAGVSLHQAILLLPLFFMACDIWMALTPQKAGHHSQFHKEHAAAHTAHIFQRSPAAGSKDSASLGGKFHISFCTSCSFKNNAMRTKNLLETNFPGTEVILSNYPPPAHKRMFAKLVPVVQFGGIGLVLAGDQIFPMLGYAAPPTWYNALRQNKFGTAASSWLIGNLLQNALLNTGAFEIYYDGDLVFSKLETRRFPTDEELRESIGKVFVRKTSQVY